MEKAVLPVRFILNERDIQTTLSPGMVALDFLRRDQRLTGTKEGCREGDCGACMVLLGELREDEVRYRAVNSCLLPLGDVDGRHLVSIEGLNSTGLNELKLNPIQKSIVDEGAVQCGFCTPGFVVSLTGFFLNSRDLTYPETVDAAAGNICRCTGYTSIRRAIAQLLEEFADPVKASADRIKSLVSLRILPDYFLRIPLRLRKMRKAPVRQLDHRSRLIVAGGTDLFVQKPEEIIGQEIEFISGRRDLSGIKVKNNRCYIGSATPMEDVKDSTLLRKIFPELSNYMKLVASSPIRRRATVGGNIVNASPTGDMTILFLALNASLTLSNGKSSREVALRDFFKGYKDLDMNEGEILEAVSFSLPEERPFFNFEKVSRRKHLDIASVNSAIHIQAENGTVQNAHLSAGGVAPVPLYLRRASEYLTGKEITQAIVQEAARIANEEISPISDVRGTAEYKGLLLRQLIFAHFITLFPERIEIGELL